MTKGKASTIGSSLRARMEAGSASPETREDPVTHEKTSHRGAKETQTAEIGLDTERPEPFNTRLVPSLQRRVKLFSVSQGSRIQDIVQIALQEYLDRQDYSR